METEREPERKAATNKVMLRIAELKIAAYGLKDTPKQYVKKSKEASEL